MFGGVCFMQNGNMLCGSGWNGFMFRVGKAQHKEAISRGARPMVQKNREMPGFVWIDPESIDARALKALIAMADRYVETLPPKNRRKA
jgi:hypothetical protein